MNLAKIKQSLEGLSELNFRLPSGDYVPPHFHVTELGLVTKRSIDCGGNQHSDTFVQLQLWQAQDYDHRVAPEKLLKILDIADKVIGTDDSLEVEVEYQERTIGKFGLDFDGTDFVLVNKQTDCRARSKCGAAASKERAGCC